MRYIAYAVATVACLAVGGIATAQELNIGVGVNNDHARSGIVVRDRDHDRSNIVVRGGERAYGRERIIVRRSAPCRTTVVRSRRPNGTVVIRRIQSCR
jgi:hypothetical protein